jgi:hypothetical protein
MRGWITGLLSSLLLVGCMGGHSYQQAVCVLIDVSGTYADEKAEVVKLLKRDVLPGMVPGDTLMLIRIDSQSYEKENLEVMLTLEDRPSRANAQKLALAQQLDAFASEPEGSKYTDIPGAMMLAAEYLREIPSGSRVMLIFSDLAEDLPAGAQRQLGESEFEGIDVVAMNVKRLEKDGRNPEVFRKRLAEWEKRVTAAKATGWRTLMDAGKLPSVLEEVRRS